MFTGGTRVAQRIEKGNKKKTHLGSILDLGVTQRDTTMIWGYAGQVNFD